MSTSHIIGMCITICLIVGLAIYTVMGRKRTGAGNSSGVVAGVIMGTLVGGSSTVGTAQLAYNYDMSAWWFTLGAASDALSWRWYMPNLSETRTILRWWVS